MGKGLGFRVQGLGAQGSISLIEMNVLLVSSLYFTFVSEEEMLS